MLSPPDHAPPSVAEADAGAGRPVQAASLATGGDFAAAFQEMRASTLALFDGVSDRDFRRQRHPDFSPIGWHLGHIAYTEAAWILQKAGGQPLPRPELEKTFHVEGLEKSRRDAIPEYDRVCDYAADIRHRVDNWFASGAVEEHARLIHFVLQHECQHNETVNLLMAFDRANGQALDAVSSRDHVPDIDFVPAPGGPARVGSDAPAAMDNEGPVHEVAVAPFALARHPVTQAQFAGFMADGGYDTPALWSAAGWRWKSETGVDRPLYWTADAPDHPVCGVAWYEADAFSRWAGARLPTEFEWEWAARGPDPAPDVTTPWGGSLPDWRHCACEAARAEASVPNGPGGTVPVGSHPAGASPFGIEDMLGNVWEWTGSLFSPYPGFDPWPYPGYSQAYFDGCHYVLRGGSWATRRWAMRTSFRNWYQPGIRQILAGFRCARDV